MHRIEHRHSLCAFCVRSTRAGLFFPPGNEEENKRLLLILNEISQVGNT